MNKNKKTELPSSTTFSYHFRHSLLSVRPSPPSIPALPTPLPTSLLSVQPSVRPSRLSRPSSRPVPRPAPSLVPSLAQSRP